MKEISTKKTPERSKKDGGWGWVITFSSFMLSFLLDGVAYSFGLFLSSFMETFKSNKGTTSWISSVLNGMYLSAGPVASALVKVFGVRKVALSGCIIASFGLFLSAFSTNLALMILLYGGVGGFGFALMYLPSIVIVGEYFEVKRAFATGIAVCGSGVGGFVFAPLSSYLIQTYGWRGTMWIISGLVLNGAVVSGFYRPFKHDSKGETQDIHNDINTTNGKTTQGGKTANKYSNAQNYASNDTSVLEGSLENSVTKISSASSKIQNDDFRNEMKLKINNKTSVSLCCIACKENVDKHGYEHVGMFLKLIVATFDLSLFCSPTFVVYGISCFLCMFAFFVPLNFLPDYGNEIGLTSSQQAWLISAIGIASTIGRVAIGVLADQEWANVLIIYNGSFIVTGLCTACIPFLKSYPILILYSVVFGVGLSAFASLRSILMVELLGLERLASSFGLVVLCEGIATFVGSPITGSIADVTGNYNITFYVAGFVLTLTGIICIPLRRISDKEKENAIGKYHTKSQSPDFLKH